LAFIGFYWVAFNGVGVAENTMTIDPSMDGGGTLPGSIAVDALKMA
jgi:hypothetical protein